MPWVMSETGAGAEGKPSENIRFFLKDWEVDRPEALL